MRSFVCRSVAAVSLATLPIQSLQAQNWVQELDRNTKTAAFVGAQFRLALTRKASPDTTLQLSLTEQGAGVSSGRLQAKLIELGASPSGPSMKVVGVELHRRDEKLGMAKGDGGGAGMLLLGGLAIAGGAAVLASGGGNDDPIRDRGKACPLIYPPRC